MNEKTRGLIQRLTLTPYSVWAALFIVVPVYLLGQTVPLDINGAVASLVVTGQDDTAITWSWDLTLVMVTP